MALEEGMLEESLGAGPLLGILLKTLGEEGVEGFGKVRRGSGGVICGTGGVACSLEPSGGVRVAVTAVVLTGGQ
jgi:hypothetical protein